MKLIITRAEPAAGKAAEMLRVRGHEVTISPILQIVDTGNPVPEGDFSCLIITSANALAILEQRGFAGRYHDVPLFVVGDATAHKARKMGFKNTYSASGNAKDLVTLIESHLNFLNSSKNPALYICGENITSGFAKSMSEMGLRYISWTNYRANLVDQLTEKSIDFLKSGKPVGILLYSTRTAQQFAKLANELNFDQLSDNIEIYVISPAVKNTLPSNLQSFTHIASTPDEESLFALIPS